MIRFEVWVRTRIINPKDGSIVKEQVFKSKSFLLNYAKMMGALLGYRKETVVKEDGSTGTVYGYTEAYLYYCHMKGEAGDTEIGIVIGRGTTPVSIEDYCLADKIGHGTEAGQMDYGSTTISKIGYETYPAPGWSRIIVSRTFTNLSGASIDVNEIGSYLYARSKVGGIDREIRFLCLRDVLPETDTVPDGYTYTVSYEIRWSA